MTISDNLVADNVQSSGSAAGGGVWVEALTNPFFANNTITAKTSAYGGGGVAFQMNGQVEVLNAFNNIIWGNSGMLGADVWLAGTGKERIFSYNEAKDIFGAFDLSASNLDMDPDFAAAANGNYHLASGSPCISAGSPNAPSLPSTDLDGNPRVVGGMVDMGCYELTGLNTGIILNSPTVADGRIQIPFMVGGASASSFRLLQTSRMTGPWTTNFNAMLTTNLERVSHSFSAPVSSAQEFFRVVSP